jgi:hypothetical protein
LFLDHSTSGDDDDDDDEDDDESGSQVNEETQPPTSMVSIVPIDLGPNESSSAANVM